VSPTVIECANTSYEGSLIGLPLQLCSETSLGRQRSLLFWPSSDHKGSSDVAITGTGTRPRELTLGCEPPLVPPLRGQSPQVGAASQRMRSPTPPARPPALRTGTEGLRGLTLQTQKRRLARLRREQRERRIVSATTFHCALSWSNRRAAGGRLDHGR
jgi:hypothetical protein